MAATILKEKTIKGLWLTTSSQRGSVRSHPKLGATFRKSLDHIRHYIVFDFEALLEALNQRQTEDLMYVSRHVPVSVAIHDSLSESPTFIERGDPEVLVQLFVEELERRRALIVKEVNRLYPRPDDFDMLPKRAQRSLERVSGAGGSDRF